MMDVFQYNVEKYPCYKVWIILLSVVLISCLVLFNNIDYEKVYKSSGIVVDKDTLKLYCNKDDLSKIINNKKIKINEKYFAYKNPVISSAFYDSDYLFEVMINVPLDKSTNIINNVIDIKIPLHKMTILEYILQKIGGE